MAPLHESDKNVYTSNEALSGRRHIHSTGHTFTDAPAPEIADLENMGIEPGGFTLALGSGGATGLAYIAGALWALEEATGLDMRTDPDLIIGTSAGSIAGAYLRHGVTPYELAMSEPPEFTAPDPHRRRLLIPGWEDRRQLARRVIGAGHALYHHARRVPRDAPPTDDWQERFPAGLFEITEADWEHQKMPREWPERPLWVVTADVDHFERVILRRPLLETETADLRTALRASMALPGIWPPVKLDGRRLYDGGVTDSCTHLDLALRAQAKVAVGVSPAAYDNFLPIDRKHAFGRRKFNLHLDSTSGMLVEEGMNVLLMRPSGAELGMTSRNFLDRTNTEKIAKAAYESTMRRFDRPDAAATLAALAGLKER